MKNSDILVLDMFILIDGPHLTFVTIQIDEKIKPAFQRGGPKGNISIVEHVQT
jgi:hypothetical protein